MEHGPNRPSRNFTNITDWNKAGKSATDTVP